MSRFGGIPVEEKQKPMNRFGGVAIEEEEEDGFDPIQAGVSALSGLGKSGAKTLYGALDLAEQTFGGDKYTPSFLEKDNREQAMQTFTEEADKSAFGTGGEIIGDIAKYALPGALGKGLGAGIKGIAGAEVLGSAGIGSLETPEAGDSRLGNAATEAGFALGGLGAGKLLERGVEGLPLMPGARDYMRKLGGYLTPGQASSTGLLKTGEAWSEFVPGLAQTTKALREEGTEGIGKTLINKVARSFDSVIDNLSGGHEGMAQLGKVVDDGYAKAWDAIDSNAWFSGGQDSFIKNITQRAGDWAETESKALLRLVKEADKGSLKQVDNRIRKMMGNAEGDFLDELGSIKDGLRKQAGGGASTKLAKMDANYGDYLALQDTAAKTRGGRIDPDKLEKASRRLQGKRRGAEGAGPLQTEAEQLADIMVAKPWEVLNPVRRFAGGFYSPVPKGPMKAAGKAVVGETDIQKYLQKLLRTEDPEVLANLYTLSGAGGAAAGEQY